MSPNIKFFRSTHARFDPVPIQSDIVDSEVSLYCQQTEGQTDDYAGEVTSDSSERKVLPTDEANYVTMAEGRKKVKDCTNIFLFLYHVISFYSYYDVKRKRLEEAKEEEQKLVAEHEAYKIAVGSANAK